MSGLSSKRNKVDIVVVFLVFSILFSLALPMVSSILTSSPMESESISNISTTNTNEFDQIKSESKSDSQSTSLTIAKKMMTLI